jgi:hypothetical protein
MCAYLHAEEFTAKWRGYGAYQLPQHCRREKTTLSDHDYENSSPQGGSMEQMEQQNDAGNNEKNTNESVTSHLSPQ